MEIPTQDFSKELQKEIAGVEQQLSLLGLDALQQIEAKPLNEFLQFLKIFQPKPNDPEPDPFLQFLATFPLPSHLSIPNPRPQDPVALEAIAEGIVEFYRSLVNRDGFRDEYKRFLQAKRSKSG